MIDRLTIAWQAFKIPLIKIFGRLDVSSSRPFLFLRFQSGFRFLFHRFYLGNQTLEPCPVRAVAVVFSVINDKRVAEILRREKIYVFNVFVPVRKFPSVPVRTPAFHIRVAGFRVRFDPYHHEARPAEFIRLFSLSI